MTSEDVSHAPEDVECIASIARRHFRQAMEFLTGLRDMSEAESDALSLEMAQAIAAWRDTR